MVDLATVARAGGTDPRPLRGQPAEGAPRPGALDRASRAPAGRADARVDVATKVEIYELIHRLTLEGKAVLLVTSDLPELLGLSDRVIVLAGGQVLAS